MDHHSIAEGACAGYCLGAIIATLAPGSYTAVLAGKGGATGIGLVEVYDLEPAASSTLGNVSTRGFVGTGDNVIIGGLIIGDGDTPIVVLRAIGPTLASSGIGNPLLDPTIELHDGNGAVIGFNDNWKDSQEQAVSATQIARSMTARQPSSRSSRPETTRPSFAAKVTRAA